MNRTIRTAVSVLFLALLAGGVAIGAQEEKREAEDGTPVYRIPEGATFSELEVQIPRPADEDDPGDFEIAGTLNVPSAAQHGKGPWPALFFISGSGSQPRTGVQQAGRDKYLDIGTWSILDAIADLGFVVLRVDDRGTGGTPRGPKGATPDKIGFEELIGDARCCVNWLKQREEVDSSRVFLIGHSEGGLTAPVLAGEEALGIAGVVCMAGPGRNLGDVVYDQVEAANQNLPKETREKNLKIQRALMEALKKGENPDFDEVPKAVWVQVLAAKKWWYDHLNMDVEAVHKAVACPVFVAQGAADFQVSPDKDARKLTANLAQGACRDVALRIYDDLDHLFKPCGGRESNMDMYFEKREVDPQFLQDLLDWLQRHAQRVTIEKEG